MALAAAIIFLATNGVEIEADEEGLVDLTLAVARGVVGKSEIAHVGLYEHEARERGIEVDTFAEHFGELDRAMADGEEEGFVKVHVRKGTDKILGATIVARHAGEMISEVTVAMVGGVGLGTLAAVIHPYPTQAEAIKHVAGWCPAGPIRQLRLVSA